MPHLFADVQHTLRRTVPPIAWPVSLDEAKRALDLGDSTGEDTEINENIPVAVGIVEEDAQRAICNSTWELQLDQFPGVIELRRPPIRAVSSVQYVDLDGVTQTFAASEYDVDSNSAPGRILLAEGSTGWPTHKITPNAIIVTFTAGYDSDIDPIVRKAVLLALKSVYEGCDLTPTYWGLINRIRWEGGI